MITVNQELLKAALSIVGKVIPSRAALPVLTHVYLSTDNGFKLSGTDLEQRIEVEVAASGNGIDACVPFSAFSKYVDNLEEGQVTLDFQNGHLILTQGDDIKAEFNAIPGVEYPLSLTSSDKNTLTVDVEEAKWLLSSVQHAVATDESRPVLTGILIRSENDELVFASADGFRLSVTTIAHPGNPFALIMPGKAATAILKAIPDGGDVHFYFDDTRICACLPEDNGLTTTVYTQVIEGSFPDYKQIIPHKTPPFKVVKEELVKALKRASVFTEANNVEFTLSGDRMTLRSQDVEYGDSEEVVAVQYGGDDIVFALNYSYTLDALSTLGDIVEVEVTSGARPLVFSSNRGEHLCVLMPMAVRKA